MEKKTQGYYFSKRLRIPYKEAISVMFAASRGISVRIAGVKAKEEVKAKKRKVPIKERLYVPCMCTTCGGCLLGFFILCAGSVMVITAYFAKFLYPKEVIKVQNNQTDSAIVNNFSFVLHLKSFSYIGPPFMAVGAFIMILTCVVVCETRDKVLDLMHGQRRSDMKKRPDFYELIMMEIKQREEDTLKGEV